MVNGASVCPRKSEAATLSDSAPLVPMSQAITTAKPRTIHCITPRWYRTANSAATKITVGSTRKAKTNDAGPLGSTSALPKTNLAPSSAQPRIDSTTVTAPPQELDAGRDSQDQQRESPLQHQSPEDHPPEIARRLSERKTATPRIASIPKRPRIRSAMSSRSSDSGAENRQDQGPSETW